MKGAGLGRKISKDLLRSIKFKMIYNSKKVELG